MRWTMRTVGSVGVAAVLASAISLVAPGTASACSCAAFETPEAAVSAASAVFTGTPTSTIRDGGTDLYEFTVEEVFLGDVGATTTVGTLADGNGCGTSYSIGQSQLMFVSKPYDVDAEWEGYACSPNANSTNAPFDIREATERVHGAPRPPSGSSEGFTAWTRIESELTWLRLGASTVVLGLGFWALMAWRGRRRRT